MRFVVDTRDGTTELTELQLLDLLIKKSTTQGKHDLEVLGPLLAQYLEGVGVLSQASIAQLLTIGAQVGYRYKVFLLKNDVAIIDEHEKEHEGTDHTISEPSGF